MKSLANWIIASTATSSDAIYNALTKVDIQVLVRAIPPRLFSPPCRTPEKTPLERYLRAAPTEYLGGSSLGYFFSSEPASEHERTARRHNRSPLGSSMTEGLLSLAMRCGTPDVGVVSCYRSENGWKKSACT